jgi:two-component system, OmpR family, phosphate regulon sensor histidine kinase PhoR
MNKLTIRWIIALMSVSLLGLIFFQLYWIKSAIEVGEERFRQDVYEVLNMVANKVEKKEALIIAFDDYETSITFGSNTSFSASDSSSFVGGNSKLLTEKLGVDSLSSMKLTLTASNILTNFDTRKLFFPDSAHSRLTRDLSMKLLQFNNRPIDFRYFDNDSLVKINLEKVNRKKEMFSIAVNDWILGGQDIRNRIDKKMVDSILTVELSNKGIGITHEFAIWEEGENEAVFVSSPNHKEELKKSELKAMLFPNDLMPKSSYISIFFPSQKGFLLKKMWITLISSAILVSVIIFCFGYAIYTILQQKKLSEIKNDFINNMTHEFKTPIATIGLACEALQDKDILAHQSFQEKYLRIIRDENSRLGQQVEKVLQMATLDRKDFDLKMEPLHLHALIKQVVDQFELQILKLGGHLKLNLEAEHELLVGDEIHIFHILNNLLDNAIKYSKDKPEIEVSTFNYLQYVHLIVRDKGIGMSKEAQEKIFEKFYRVPTRNLHNVKGFGLGLTYVKTMVEAHGGQIKLKSSLGKGSEFEIILPLRYAEVQITHS